MQGIPASFLGVMGPATISPTGMVRGAMISNAFDAITGADSSLVTLSGEVSLSSAFAPAAEFATAGAELATGVGEAKFLYDGITFGASFLACEAGIL
jgi:hypothetical protein